MYFLKSFIIKRENGHNRNRVTAQGCTAMPNLVRLIITLLFSSTLAHADSYPMSGYMECARALGVAINDKFSVIPGERSGDKGLFVYTDRSAFFLPLGAPHTEDGDAQEFFLRTNIASVGDIFLVFRARKPGSKSNIQSAIGYQTTPPPKADLNNYRVTPASAAIGSQAKYVLSKRLKEKIATVKDFIDDKNSFSTPGEAKLAFEKDRVIYRAKLKACYLEEDRDLKLAVLEEVQKLETGFPGITIWEKHVGGKPPAAQTGKTVSGIY